MVKRLIERGAVDDVFVAAHTEGWDDLVAHLATLDLDDLLEASGLTVEQLDAFVDLYAAAPAAVLVWSMGITQHRHGVEGVQGIVNVGLARGNVGRDGAGLMPIRGHSGVQGGAEMGAYATALPGGLPVDAEHAAALGEQWGFDVPAVPGLTATEQVEAAERGELDVLYVDGGNFLEVLPDPARVARALGRVPLRVHQDVMLSSQMLVDGDDVILLPAATRYEQEGGGTETTTERRVAFSPEIPRQVGEARSEWRIFAELAVAGPPRGRRSVRVADQPGPAGRDRRRHPGLRGHRAAVGDRRLGPVGWAAPLRRRSVPDAVGPGPLHGARPADASTCPRARSRSPPAGASSSTRWSSPTVDPLNGAGRDDVLIDEGDAARLGLGDGDRLRLRNDVGTFDGTARLVRLPSRTLQVHWPEGNVLLPSGPEHREPGSQVPDYNAVVWVEPLPA